MYIQASSFHTNPTNNVKKNYSILIQIPNDNVPCSTATVIIIILCLTPAIPAVNPVEVPKEPEFVIFASYSHPPNTPMRHSVLKEMVSRIIIPSHTVKLSLDMSQGALQVRANVPGSVV